MLFYVVIYKKNIKEGARMKCKKITAFVLAAVMLFTLALPSLAANRVPAPGEWVALKDEIFAPEGKISLTPGENESCMNFAWVSSGLVNTEEMFIYGKESDLSDGVYAEVVVVTTTSVIYTSNRVSLNSLDKGKYYYNYTYNGEWQGIESFEIKSADGDFSVMLCSDPQLGRSGDDTDEAILDDTYGWHRTLEAAKRNCSDIRFMLCAGDEVNSALSKKEYNALLYPEALKSLPVAAAVGNHDYYSTLYKLHYNNPNTVEDDFTSMGGNGYYFTYGNALFIVINSNNYVIEDHRAVISEAINSAPNAKWRIVMMHTSLYFSGMKEKHQNNIELFAPMFDEYDIDLVVSGHEHLYSRTAPMTNDSPSEGGVTYLAVATASGCSFDRYDRCDSRVVKCENMYEPSYSILDIGENEISVKSYYTDKDEIFDEFTIEKSEEASGEVEDASYDWLTRIIFAIVSAVMLIFK